MGKLLSPEQVSELLNVPTKTLAKWRLYGRGPRYRKLSGNLSKRGAPVRYEASAIEEWVESLASGGGQERGAA